MASEMNTQQTVERTGNLATVVADTARQAADEVGQRTRRAVDQLAGTAGEVADRMSAQANDALAQTLRYTSAHPLQALAVVLVAGFLVGRLSRRY